MTKRIVSIRRLRDVERFLAGKHDNEMSGDTSSPTDGGHINRVLPHPAALRWHHYHFVSPLHQSRGVFLSPLPFLIFLITGIFSDPLYAQLGSFNPASSSLEEIQAQLKQEQRSRARQLEGTHYASQRLISGMSDLATERQIQDALSSNGKTLQDHEQSRQQAQKYLEDEKERATRRTKEVRGEQETGFRYSLQKQFDGTFARIETRADLPVMITGEAVKTDFGISRRNREITYYGKGGYYRLPYTERAEVISETGDKPVVEVSETLFEKYLGESHWWSSNRSGHYAFPTTYTTTSTSSVTPYKIDTVRISETQPQVDFEKGKWYRESWVEETTSTEEPGILYRRQVFMANYDPSSDNLLSYFSIAWSPKAEEELVLIEYQVTYTSTPDGRQKPDTEEIKRTEVPAPSDPKLAAILDYLLKGELVPFELVQYAYGISIQEG